MALRAVAKNKLQTRTSAPMTVSTIGSPANGDMRAFAALLLRMDEKVFQQRREHGNENTNTTGATAAAATVAAVATVSP
jgi:hypothetical protein